MQAEPFLELFIPDAACLECSDHHSFECIDAVALLKFACPNMVVELTEALELTMESESMTSSIGDQLECALVVV